MKISMLVLNNFINDARVHKEAVTLASAGHNVTVIALWQPGLARIKQMGNYRVIRIHLKSRSWKNRFLSPPLKYLEFAWRVWLLAGRDPQQVYHANDANTLPAAWLAAKRNHAKIVYDAHELETGRNFSGGFIPLIYRTIWALPEKILIHKAHSVITVSQSIAVELARLYRISSPQVILNCPVNFDIPKSNLLRKELSIPDEYSILLYQGRVSFGRGIEAFLSAIQRVERTVGVIVGGGPAVEKIHEHIRLGKFKRVFLLGQVPLGDLPAYTASADIGMVLTQDTCLNHRFSLPNKLFEYLHAGLPVICSNLPEMAKVVLDYQVGELTDPDNPTAIAGSIQTILADPNRYAQMKVNARKAADIFNWQNEEKILLNIYNNLQ